MGTSESTAEHGNQVGNDDFDLPEDRNESFDEAALLEAMRDYRRREFAELAHLDS